MSTFPSVVGCPQPKSAAPCISVQDGTRDRILYRYRRDIGRDRRHRPIVGLWIFLQNFLCGYVDCIHQVLNWVTNVKGSYIAYVKTHRWLDSYLTWRRHWHGSYNYLKTRILPNPMICNIFTLNDLRQSLSERNTISKTDNGK